MKKFRVKVDGKEYEVEVEAIDESNENLGNMDTNNIKNDYPKKADLNNKKTNNTEETVGEDILAPLPGTISVRVKKGEKVSKGEIIIILEAMKMENEITAPIDGTVQELYVSTGDSVETGELMARII